MKQPFCAVANKQSGEDLVGTASQYQTYVLIECPTPWSAKAFESKPIPPALRRYVQRIKAERSVQFLLVSRGGSTISSDTTLIVYKQLLTVEGVVKTYRGCEFRLSGLEQVEACLDAYWKGDRIGKPIPQTDILICTHGTRDKCCACFGQPFFKNAVRSARLGNLPNTRLWKVSHIGGHRFAPTVITLPDGRYYGRLTLPALESIVNRSGSIEQIQAVYRGWGVLPAPLQILERKIFIEYGWSWFDKATTYRVLAETESELIAEISVSDEANQLAAAKWTETKTYRARLTQDHQGKVWTKLSCDHTATTPVVRYQIAECAVLEAAECVGKAAQ